MALINIYTFPILTTSSQIVNDQSNKRLFLTGMILSMTCWGFSWTAGKVMAAYGPPMTISFLRFTVTFVSMLLILVILKESFRISKKGLPDLLAASVTISIYTYLFFKGLVTGKAGAGGVLVTVMNPIFSYAIMLAMAKRRPTRNETIGLLLGLLAGVVLLKLPMEADKIFSAGNIYFLLAAIAWAILSVFTSRASR